MEPIRGTWANHSLLSALGSYEMFALRLVYLITVCSLRIGARQGHVQESLLKRYLAAVHYSSCQSSYSLDVKEECPG